MFLNPPELDQSLISHDMEKGLSELESKVSRLFVLSSRTTKKSVRGGKNIIT